MKVINADNGGNNASTRCRNPKKTLVKKGTTLYDGSCGHGRDNAPAVTGHYRGDNGSVCNSSENGTAMLSTVVHVLRREMEHRAMRMGQRPCGTWGNTSIVNEEILCCF